MHALTCTCIPIREHIGIDNNKNALAGGDGSSVPVIQQAVIIIVGIGTGRAWGAAAPLNAGCRGLCPPTNLHQWVLETWCEIKLPVVIHSGMAQKHMESFFARLRGKQQL